MQHLPKRDQHIGNDACIVACPVMIEGRQIQMLRHDVQLVLTKAGQEVLCHDQGIHIGWVKLQSHLLAAGADKTNIKLRVMGRKGPSVYKLQKVRQGILQFRSILEHLIGNSR